MRGNMRTSLVSVLVVLATVMVPGAALSREPTLEVDTNRVDFETVTSPTIVYSDGIRITNISDEPIALHLTVELTKPRDWNEQFNPLVVEDAGIPPSWDPCDELAPGATCIVYLAFQPDRPGKYAAWVWINDTYRIKVTGVAT
jgi:hypothetical protein